MHIYPSIFREYDIRGVYPSEVNGDVAYAIGKGYAALVAKENPEKKLRIAIGSDMRLSGPELKERLIAGLIESGLDVEDMGLVSTPVFYFGVARFDYDGGIQVSASHNPKDWNGFKIVRRGAVAMGKSSGVGDIERIIKEEAFISALVSGSLRKKEGVLDAAVEDALSRVKNVSAIRPLRVVVDAANGMGALDMGALFAKLPCDMVKMNFELDGNFPAHEADPMKSENIRPLCERVKEEGADLGIAPDGDGDRYFFVDEKGEPVPQPILRGLMARVEIEEHPEAKVAYDIRPGRITRDIIEEAGGVAVVTRVGHSLIKETMMKEGAIFGGESSGHYFYALPHGTFEAPFDLVLKFLRFLSGAKQPLSEAVAPYKKYAHSGERNIRVATREEVTRAIEKIKEKYADGKQSLLDGITVEYGDFWFNVRASNTEPLLRVNFEARNEEILSMELQKLFDTIQ